MPSVSRVFYDTQILHGEGGYKPRHAQDDETLFGYRIDNFTRAIAALSPAERAALPDDVESRLNNPRGLMRYIAGKLTPSSNERGPDGLPRTSEMPRSHASANDIRAVNAVKNLAFDAFKEHYCDELHFNRFPQNIANQATMISLHRWQGVANWTIAKAMVDMGIGDPRHYPYVPTSQTVDDATFRNSAAGKAYFSTQMADQIAQDLSHATPQQLQLMEFYICKWRRTFYTEQVKYEKAHGLPIAEYHEACLKGWLDRVNNSTDLARLAPLAAAYEQARGSHAAAPKAAHHDNTAANSYSWSDIGMCAITLGLNCHPTAKPPRQR